jgi:ABC-type multidrug transport system fused ATPase/permease subunit
MAYYDNKENTPGALLTKLSSDTTKINGIALSMISILFQTICTVVLGVTLALVYYWKIALINMGFLPIIIATFAFQWRIRQGFGIKDEVLESQAGSILSESVCNTKTIFSYNMQYKVVNMYIDILTSKDKENFKSSFLIGLLFDVSQCILLFDYATLFYAGASFISNGDNVTLADFLKSMFCIIFAGIGLGQAQQYVGDMESAKKALLNIFNTLDTESKIDPLAPKPEAKDADNIKGKIEFRNVYFSYPSKKDVVVLKDLSFKIEAGQSIAFVGKSGCGKSSIIQLLERFYDVDQGEILIDDINIKDYDILKLRKKISLVMQEPVLFNDDVVKNVNYGDLTKGYAEVKEAMKIANISELLNPEYDQKVIPVSGGQKQRLAIARAMIRDPRILLLDEATSALDKTNEDAVQKTLNEVMKGRTSISIAHRY